MAHLHGSVPVPAQPVLLSHLHLLSRLSGLKPRQLLDQCDSFADGKKSAHEQRFSVVRRTGSLIGGMTG